MPETILKLGPDDAGLKLTHDEFVRAEFEPRFQYERVRGRLVVMSPAGEEHRRVSCPIRRELGGYWHRHQDIVEDVDVEGWLATSDDDDRFPDICVYLQGPTSGERRPQRVPEIIFEFVSSSRADQERDYIDKREEYHRVGVKEYVIVDRFKNEVLVLTWASGDFEEQVLQSTDAYESSLLPDLSIPLAECFADS